MKSGFLVFAMSLIGVLVGCSHGDHSKMKSVSDSACADLPQAEDLHLRDLNVLSVQKLERKKSAKNQPGGWSLGPQKPLDLVQSSKAVLPGATVVRIVGTWCPYCKQDMTELHHRFLQSPNTALRVVFIAYKSQRESPESLSKFMDSVQSHWGVNPDSFELYYFTGKQASAFKSLQTLTDKTDQILFPGLRGVPYGLVFDSKGLLRMRGHFTGSKTESDEHYGHIRSLIECLPKGAHHLKPYLGRVIAKLGADAQEIKSL